MTGVSASRVAERDRDGTERAAPVRTVTMATTSPAPAGRDSLFPRRRTCRRRGPAPVQIEAGLRPGRGGDGNAEEAQPASLGVGHPDRAGNARHSGSAAVISERLTEVGVDATGVIAGSPAVDDEPAGRGHDAVPARDAHQEHLARRAGTLGPLVDHLPPAGRVAEPAGERRQFGAEPVDVAVPALRVRGQQRPRGRRVALADGGEPPVGGGVHVFELRRQRAATAPRGPDHLDRRPGQCGRPPPGPRPRPPTICA